MQKIKWEPEHYRHSYQHQFDHMGQTSLAKHLIFIPDTELHIHQHKYEQNAALIRQCRRDTGRLPVLTLDGNPYDVDSYLSNLEKYIGTDEFFVFNSDIRPEVSTQKNLAPWPSWLCRQQIDGNAQLNRPKVNRISFLSGVVRYHRIALFREIQPYIKDSDIVVVNSFLKEHFINTIPVDLAEHIDIDEWVSGIPWANHQRLFDTDQTETSATNQHSTDHPAYAACINITGETLGAGDQVLISEKTWKAYISGCLVVNYGIEKMSSCLKNFGLEIWTEYDKGESLENSIVSIVELFQRDDIEEIYKKQYDMICYNQNLVNSLDFLNKLAQPAFDKISEML